MKDSLAYFSVLCAVVLTAACAGPESNSDDVENEQDSQGELTPQDCAGFDSIEDCTEAGCGTARVIRKGSIVDDACTMKPADDEVCVAEKAGSNVETEYTRVADDGTREVWTFSQNVGPVHGWTQCSETDLGDHCGCER